MYCGQPGSVVGDDGPLVVFRNPSAGSPALHLRESDGVAGQRGDGRRCGSSRPAIRPSLTGGLPVAQPMVELEPRAPPVLVMMNPAGVPGVRPTQIRTFHLPPGGRFQPVKVQATWVMRLPTLVGVQVTRSGGSGGSPTAVPGVGDDDERSAGDRPGRSRPG